MAIGTSIGHSEVRTIQSGELNTVHRLTYECYVAQGYCAPRPDGRFVHYPHLDNIRETTVFVAVRGREIVGSISVTVDGPRGLPVDRDFKEKVDGIRRWGAPLGAAWRIVVKPGHRDGEVLLALLQAAVRATVRLPAKVWLFALNPKHETRYQALLKFRTIARSEETRGLANAPAVLMIAGIDESVEFLERVERRRDAAATERAYGRLVKHVGTPTYAPAMPVLATVAAQ
jgi:hypothetical protein